ncbi:MAG: hypothetical protein OES79_15445, partial [Planctomycetota bacterium]|nr:hypothetical protein [Planctomycetota bacterium]
RASNARQMTSSAGSASRCGMLGPQLSRPGRALKSDETLIASFADFPIQFAKTVITVLRVVHYW